MLGKKNMAVESNLFDLFNYKLSCFLNTRNKARRWKDFSYVKWEEDVLDLNVVVNKRKLDLIRWYDNLSDIEERRVAILKSKFTDNDFECIKTVLSRFGYLFKIQKKQSDKDYRLFFFVIQLINMKNNKSIGDRRSEYMTSLCQQLLCELFLCYEDFSRFSIDDDGVLFETENIGSVNLFDIINILFLNKKTDDSCELGAFYISLIRFLFISDNGKYHLNFDDKNEKFIYPDFFIHHLNDETNKSKLFNLIPDMLDLSQSSNEIFISNMLLMSYIFYFLKCEQRNILQIKKYLNDDDVFLRFFEAIIKRRLIIGKEHFTDLGLDDYLSKIQLNETHFYNILNEA
ncbi:hypothetical protein GE191_05455 [Serratia fonticola]|uniref:hypothetical protein n=1 Tax=Serratia fonticola TaxID=47917 RepID=UPI001376D607|nr:hypothetical protein [Serratia fonticola]NBJ33120.1 hypothetical protein [Serratia fonticola]